MNVIRALATLFCLSNLLLFNSCTGCSQDDDVYVSKKNVEVQGEVGSSATHVPINQNVSTVVRMVKDGGVYKVPVRINGVEMDFIFDTGASAISISNLEASYLVKQGKISKDDVEGYSQFVDALGNVSVGTYLNLREVSIGGHVVNDVKANVVNNSEAPLLLGQSFLEKFGKISIDYNEGTITFN